MIDLRSYFRYIPSQENVSCCTASATLLACEYLYARHGDHKHFSRLFLYYMTRKLQGRVGQKGAELKETMRALSKYGCCLEVDWPFMANRENREPISRAVDNAKNYMLEEYDTLDSINFKEYLNNELPVVVGMNVGRRFLRLAGPITEHTYCKIGDNNRYSRGHALVIVGYDDTLCGGSWIAANSMGLKWGDRGFAAIPYECNQDIGEAYVVKRFGNKTTEKKISDN